MIFYDMACMSRLSQANWEPQISLIFGMKPCIVCKVIGASPKTSHFWVGLQPSIYMAGL